MPVTLPFDLADAQPGDGISLVVVDRDGVQYEVKMGGPAAEYLTAAWFDTLGMLQQHELVPYSPEVVTRPDDGRALVITDDLRDEHQVVEELLADGDLPLAAPSEVPDELYLYAAVSDTEAGRVAMVKKKNPTKRARGGKVLFGAGDELRRLDEDPWELHPHFDVVISEEGGFALSTHFFDQLFADSPRLRAKIVPWVEDIGAQLGMSIDSKTKLIARCDGSPRLRRRLRAIAHRGHLERVTLEEVRRHAQQMDLTVSDFVDGDELVVTDKNVEAMLRLLNEDFSRGGLTNDPFVIEAKEPMR